MQALSANEIREKYLSFFEGKGHKRLPSASLVPHNDPTLLLTGAGMVPFKPYFLGREKAPYSRVTTCQRCLRLSDVDNVGRTDRHATFFEMLGNFSFNDYFKREAIIWAWEFTTEHLEFPKERLWVSIFCDDDEAEALWMETARLPKERIVRLGEEDNFWQIGVGPCGPCSELYIDRGPDFGCGRDSCRPGCDCDRYLEFWNLVFIQYYQDEEGNRTPLDRKGIDTGMGLERVAAICQGARSIFGTDLLRPILEHCADLAGVRYGDDEKADASLRVITEHMRGITFLVFDGVVPGREGRGYVLRRLLRRCARHGRLLGIDGPFLAGVVDVVVEVMAGGYPQLREKADYIKDVVTTEEKRFYATLDQGMSILAEMLQRCQAEGRTQLSGEDAFLLHDTYGFPLELTKEIAAESGLEVDEEGYEKQMDRQRQKARAARSSDSYLGDGEDDQFYSDLAARYASTFVGYDTLLADAQVLCIVKRQGAEGNGRMTEPVVADELQAGQTAEVVLSRTPFYAEGGGQVADKGEISWSSGKAKVEHVRRPVRGLVVHQVKVTEGVLRPQEQVRAIVGEEERLATARNHTATHLLHRALHLVLGEHATQAGSYVGPDRLRFDFNNMKPVSPEDLWRIEELVNREILRNSPVNAQVMSLQQARSSGALALFGEQYGEEVRVVSCGEFSKELCGGTHVRATGEIGQFKIVSESSVASGVRRIEAVTGLEALRLAQEYEEQLNETAQILGVARQEVARRSQTLTDELRQAEKELEQLRRKLATKRKDELVANAEEIAGSYVLVAEVPGVDASGLRALGDELKAKLKSAVIVLGSSFEGKAVFVGMATSDLAPGRVHVGDILREAARVAGGGGGGRPDMAQAGGRDPERLGDALQKARELARSRLTPAR